MKITNIKIISVPKELPFMITCPLCEHTSEILLQYNSVVGKKSGAGEGQCHRCGAVMSFDWAQRIGRGGKDERI